jgi:hypothetical protein
VISRRSFLAGAGAAVSLPLLEGMLPGHSARAGGPGVPLRFLVVFGGVSLGNGRGDMVTPATAGAGWELSRGLRSLGGRTRDMRWDWDDVQSEVSVVSALRVPYGNSTEAPPGGRITPWHVTTLAPLFTGVRSLRPGAAPRGPSSDEIVADAIAGDTRLRNLTYKVQAQSYRGGTGTRNRMSYGLDASGAVVPTDPITSPRIAYDQLFRGFTPSDPMEAEGAGILARRDRSVLDLVRSSTDRLRGRLGSADRLRLQRHFDEIRDLEGRITEIPEVTPTCAVPARPGEDPEAELTTRTVDGEEIVFGWSNEELRGRVMFDMVRMAFACDLSRVATVMITDAQSYMSVEPITGIQKDAHQIGHGEGPEEMADVVSWHVGHLARFISDLRNTPDGDGTLLDHTAIVFITEGGHGLDPETGNQSSHSSEDMLALCAGRAGGLQPGRHIRATGRHPAQVTASAMQAVGVDNDGLGEVEGQIGELFG